MLVSPSGIVVAISKRLNLDCIVCFRMDIVMEKRELKANLCLPLRTLNCGHVANDAAVEFLKGSKTG